MKTLLSATLSGINADVVDVETTFTKGLPSFSIVGLPNTAIQESKDRVKSALFTNGFTFPPLKITVNLSPSDLQKTGSHFDLPIALSIALQNEQASFEDFGVFGELGLNGQLKDTALIYPILLSLAQSGTLKKAIVPKESLSKVSRIPGLSFYGVESLEECVTFLKNPSALAPSEPVALDSRRFQIGDDLFYYTETYGEDFYDVKGQELAKRAALIAAAGMHNLLLEGSPGCGKSMISKRIRHILPPLRMEEILLVAKADSLNGTEPSFEPKRPFRSPHHTSTKASIFGGGTVNASIGEVALANKGILFFDELPHFPKSILEALREPLEDNYLHISRVNSKITYETDILFIAAQNPCPCGNLLSTSLDCRCSQPEVQRYKSRLSEPFLDRIDLFVSMQEISSDDRPSLSSAEMHQKVLDAFTYQMQRGQTTLNGKLNDASIARFCALDSDCEAILQKAVSQFGLSQRSINKLKKTARTIADLDGAESISKSHLLESLSFRKR